MTDKILVICKLVEGLLNKYKEKIIYLPLSNEDSDRRWQELLSEYQPKTILFGLQNLDDSKMSAWRSLIPNEKLRFVRKGTSLHRVDFAAAKKYNIEILNTAGINSPFVAGFICDQLSAKLNSVAVLGVGDIGKKVVNKLMQSHERIFLYTRTRGFFENTRCIYSNDLAEIFSNVEQVVVSLPLNEETKGIILAQHIHALPKNAEIICVSPPRVFSKEAILALHQRDDIKIIFDHVASGLSHIHESLGHQNLRSNFIFEEKAASSNECQYAMGEAAILKAIEKPKMDFDVSSRIC